jgi:hypothetical protein
MRSLCLTDKAALNERLTGNGSLQELRFRVIFEDYILQTRKGESSIGCLRHNIGK